MLGKTVSLEQVARITAGDSGQGTSLAALQSAAEDLGLEARCYRMSLRDLAAMPSGFPAVAHVDGDHFVVVWRIATRKVAVAQPPFGLDYMSLDQFGRRWTGATMLVSRPGEQPRLGHPLIPWLLAMAAAALGFSACEWALGRGRRRQS